MTAMEKNRPVTDLKKEDLELWIGEKEQTISYLSFNPQVPLVIGLEVDASGSEKSKWPGPILGLAPGFFQRVMRTGDEAFLVDFGDDAHLEVRPTSDPTVIDQGLNNMSTIRPHGGTALYDAIEASSKLFGGFYGSRHVLIVVTDGRDNMSKHTRGDAEETARASATTVYFLANTSEGGTRGLFNGAPYDHGIAVTTDIARSTGGQVFSGLGEPEVAKALGKIAVAVQSQYALEFQPTSSELEGSKVRVKCLRRGVKIVAPDKF